MKNEVLQKPNRKTTIVSVSLESELHQEAKKTAHRLGMTVSMLVRQLLRRQIQTGGDLTVSEKPE